MRRCVRNEAHVRLYSASAVKEGLFVAGLLDVDEKLRLTLRKRAHHMSVDVRVILRTAIEQSAFQNIHVVKLDAAVCAEPSKIRVRLRMILLLKALRRKRGCDADQTDVFFSAIARHAIKRIEIVIGNQSFGKEKWFILRKACRIG